MSAFNLDPREFEDDREDDPWGGRKNPTVDIRDVEICAETEKAILVDKDTWDDPQWFPLSQIESIHRAKEGTYKSWIVVTRWIAQKKGVL